MRYDASISDLLGLTLTHIERLKEDGGDVLLFTATDGRTFKMYHWQDCCEDVYLEDVTGNLDDLIGSPLLKAEELSNQGSSYGDDVSEWTFYHLATVKGYVTLRWFGSSNGYYSTSVDFREL